MLGKEPKVAKNQHKDPDGDSVPFEINDIINTRLIGGNDKKETSEMNYPLATTPVGELRLIDPNEVHVSGERYRRFIKVDDLEISIGVNGQFVPILVRPDMTLVNGMRRLAACKALGVLVLAHVVEIVNTDIAQIEEDRCRQDLLPSEMFRITEAMRPQFEDEAWARKVLGKAADKARKKGRVDDLLADHVGISRGTLRKIREIYGASSVEPEKYAAIVEAMEQDSRIDRHYKAFKDLSQPAYDGKKLQAVGIDPAWQSVSIGDTASLLSAVQRLGLKELVEDNAVVFVPSTIYLLPAAFQIVVKSGAKLVQACTCGDSSEILLIGRFGKGPDASDATLANVMSHCASFENALNVVAPAQNRTVIDLTQALRQERKAA